MASNEAENNFAEDEECDPKDSHNKKRKSRSELRKEKKRKKRKRGDSGEESVFMYDKDNAADLIYRPSRKSKKSRSNAAKANTSAPSPVATAATFVSTSPVAAPAKSTVLPSVEEVCATYGLNDVKMQCTEANEFYMKYVHPILSKYNAKISVGEFIILLASKWNDFSSGKLNTELTESDREEEPDYTRIRTSKTPVATQNEIDDEEEEIEDRKKKRNSSRSKKGNSKKSSNNSEVPTLKIKLGKRRHGSSDEEGGGSAYKAASDLESNADLEQTLPDVEEAVADKSEIAAPESEAPAERKAETEFGRMKKKKKTKITSKPPGGDELCRVCQNGGELLCCFSCSSIYHTFCLNPPVTTIPDNDWKCPRCSPTTLPSKVSRIINERCKPNPYQKNDDSKRQRPKSLTEDNPKESSKCSAAKGTNTDYENIFGKIIEACDVNGRSLYHPFLLLPSKKKHPEYFNVVKNPIDLRIIARKVRDSKYLKREEIFDDLLRLVANARSIFKYTSTSYADAALLKEIILKIKNQSDKTEECAIKYSIIIAELKYEDEKYDFEAIKNELAEAWWDQVDPDKLKNTATSTTHQSSSPTSCTVLEDRVSLLEKEIVAVEKEIVAVNRRLDTNYKCLKLENEIIKKKQKKMEHNLVRFEIGELCRRIKRFYISKTEQEKKNFLKSRNLKNENDLFGCLDYFRIPRNQFAHKQNLLKSKDIKQFHGQPD